MHPTQLIIDKSLLMLAGSLLLAISAYIIASPEQFYASNAIDIGSNVSLLNELKAPAGLLMVAGSFILVAVYVDRLTGTALLLASMVYLSYAGARLVSMLMDGLPATGLVQATMLEAGIGLACLAVVVRRPAILGSAQ